MGRRMNGMGSPTLNNSKVSKSTRMDNPAAVPRMSAKALKMLGVENPNETKNEFANFQFDERELAMFDATPNMSSPHLMSKNHIRPSSNSSKEFISYPPPPPEMMNMNMEMGMEMGMPMNREMSLEALEEEEEIKQSILEEEEEDLLREANMMTMGSVHSNNSFNSAGNTSFMSQKAMKVFGISENDLLKSPEMVNRIKKTNPLSPRPMEHADPLSPRAMSDMSLYGRRNRNGNGPMSPRTPTMSINPSPLSPHHRPMAEPAMDNLNLSRYCINDGENQINGIISSKALKIIGLSENSSNLSPGMGGNLSATSNNININDLKKMDYGDGRKGLKTTAKREKLMEWEEATESVRSMMPTLASLKSILTDYLYFNTHGLKGWKKRFVILSHDNWIHYFPDNDPKGRALASIPINSNTTIEEYIDPLNIVPFYMEIISCWPIDTDNRRYITIGCDSKQKCQSWVTAIKSIITRDKFSSTKLPPKPPMVSGSVSGSVISANGTNNSSIRNSIDDDLDMTGIHINPNPVQNPLMSPNFRGTRTMSMNPSVAPSGDLGSLYDDITGYSSTPPTGFDRNNSFDSSMASPTGPNPLMDYPAVKRTPGKNMRLTKHPARKESFKPRYASVVPSPAMNGFYGNVLGNRLNSPSSQSTIPMVSSSPLIKGQQIASSFNPYGTPVVSPSQKGLNVVMNGVSSPSLTPMSIPSVPSISPTPVSSLTGNSTPQMKPTGFRRPTHSPQLLPHDMESMNNDSNSGHKISSLVANSPLLSPQSNSSPMMGSAYLHQQPPPAPKPKFSSMEENLVDYEPSINNSIDFDQNRILQQQEQLIKQQQQQILLLQKKLLQNQKEMEQGFLSMSPKDRNFY